MLASKIKFGLILHRFKGPILQEKEENKASEEHTLALGLAHAAG